MFCPKCGKLMLPKKENGKSVMICSCGYSSKADVVKEAIEKKEAIAVVEDEEAEVVHPIEPTVVCPKCGNKGAYFWEVQTRAGDKAATKSFKCTKCKHIWRDYS